MGYGIIVYAATVWVSATYSSVCEFLLMEGAGTVCTPASKSSAGYSVAVTAASRKMVAFV